jgi:TonB family protein
MNEPMLCGGCGKEMPPGGTICRHCGWDLSAVLSLPPRPSTFDRIRAGGWRVLVCGVLLALPIVGFVRLQATGPGPDLATTLRWLAFGDDGRAAELVTIHRMHEIGAAVSRYMVRENEIPPFDGDWAEVLAPSATARVRGWIPLVFFGADTVMAPDSVREMYEVRAVDGWGRPYRVHTRQLPREVPAADRPEVAADLEGGLHATFFTRDVPDLEHGEWLRLELVSAGRDGDFDTVDDLRMVSYIQIGHVFRLLYNPDEVKQQVERVGNLNYPEQAKRQNLTGSLVLDVAINPDGSISAVQVLRPSRHKLLDDAAVRIVELAGPYAPLPPDIRAEVDILHITRTWKFRESGVVSEAN